jgi:hypothetical protein
MDQSSLPRPGLLVDPKDQEQKNLAHKPGKKEIKEAQDKIQTQNKDIEKIDDPRLLWIG